MIGPNLSRVTVSVRPGVTDMRLEEVRLLRKPHP